MHFGYAEKRLTLRYNFGIYRRPVARAVNAATDLTTTDEGPSTMAIKTLAALAIAGTLATGMAHANESNHYTTIGAWDVRIDTGDAAPGCYAQATYPNNGTILRFGFADNSGAPFYIVLINPAWTSLTEGTRYYLEASFSGMRPVLWEAYSMKLTSGLPGLRMNFSNKAILDAIAYSTALRVTFQGQMVLAGNLPGSAAAMTTVAQCELSLAPKSTPDPFRAKQLPSDKPDPFRL